MRSFSFCSSSFAFAGEGGAHKSPASALPRITAQNLLVSTFIGLPPFQLVHLHLACSKNKSVRTVPQVARLGVPAIGDQNDHASDQRQCTQNGRNGHTVSV